MLMGAEFRPPESSSKIFHSSAKGVLSVGSEQLHGIGDRDAIS
jgi:hypothetical protein